jgi:hypothetical protein
MPVVAQLLRKLPEPRKMDHRLLGVRAKNNMANVRAMCVRPLAYHHRHSVVCQGTIVCHSRGNRSRVIAKSDEFGEPVFTLMDI